MTNMLTANSKIIFRKNVVLRQKPKFQAPEQSNNINFEMQNDNQSRQCKRNKKSLSYCPSNLGKNGIDYIISYHIRSYISQVKNVQLQ